VDLRLPNLYASTYHFIALSLDETTSNGNRDLWLRGPQGNPKTRIRHTPGCQEIKEVAVSQSRADET
jgi:hypothetical protein